MKNKRTLSIATIAMAVLFIITVVWMNRLSSGSYGENNKDYKIRNMMDELAMKVATSGPNALKEYQTSIWHSRDDEYMNALIVDEEGKIITRKNNLFFGDEESLNLMVSPYLSDNYQPLIETMWSDWRVKVALIVNDAGDIQEVFTAPYSEVARGQQLPKYQTYFPTLNEWLLERGDFSDPYDYSYEMHMPYYASQQPIPFYASQQPITMEPTIVPEPYPTPQPADYNNEESVVPTIAQPEAAQQPEIKFSEMERVEQYRTWERAQLIGAGTRQITALSIGKGQTLVVAYFLDETLYEDEIQAEKTERFVRDFIGVIIIIFMLYWILLALWVFVDARGRHFKPALWGVFTLFGNIIAWIVYMMVRPEIAKPRSCPVCAVPIQRDFVVCPSCATKLTPCCPSCSKPLDATWRVCPYCATPIANSSLPHLEEQTL